MKLIRLKFAILVGMVFAFASTSVLAITEAELETKLKSLEKKREADAKELGKLKQQVKGLRSKVESKTGEPSSKVSKKIKRLKKNVKSLDKKSKKRVSSLKKTVNRDSEKLRVNGFLSAGFSRATEATEQQPYNYDDTFNFRTDTTIGVQFTYKLSDRIQTIVQLVSHGYNDFETKADWALIKYQATDDLVFRAGRMRLPIFFYSETLDIGYSYPWVRLPLETSNSSLINYEGGDVLYRFNVSDWNIATQAYTGRFLNNELGGVGDAKTGFETEDIYGISFTASRDVWNFRLAFFRANIKFETGVEFGGGVFTFAGRDTLEYLSTAALYDDGTFYWLAEFGGLRTDRPGGDPSISNTSEGLVAADGASTNDYVVGHTTFGYRIGRGMVFYSASFTDSPNDSEQYDTTDGFNGRGNLLGAENNKSNSIGIRYEVTNNVALKYQLDYFYDFADSNDQTLIFGVNGSGTKPDFGNSVTINSLVIDAVF